MKQTIRLYVTTRANKLGDLDDVKDSGKLAKWKEDVQKLALETKTFEYPDDEMIDAMSSLAIAECYAVVAYPPGRISEADDQIGKPLLKFLRKNSEKLTWALEETGLSAVTVEELSEKHKRLTSGNLWDNFTYGLIADKRLKENEYEVDLEVIVKE
jgi:hypothetical protein